MPNLGKEIHALEYKLRILADCLHEAGKLDDRSRKKLAARIGVNYETLKSAWGSGRVSPDLEKKICEAGNFSAEDNRWNDPDIPPEQKSAGRAVYVGRDNVDNFRIMVRERLGLARVLMTRMKGKAASVFDSNLATFALSGGQEASDGSKHELVLEAVFGSGIEKNGLEYGFQRARLRLRINNDCEAEMTRRLGIEQSFNGKGWTLTCTGHQHESFWTIEAADPNTILKGEVATRQECLCELADLTVGDSITADLAIRPLDGWIARTDGKPIANAALRRILERLEAERIGSEDSQGWITLGKQKLTLMRADR